MAKRHGKSIIITIFIDCLNGVLLVSSFIEIQIVILSLFFKYYQQISNPLWSKFRQILPGFSLLKLGK